jgi:hypothetical protein
MITSDFQRDRPKDKVLMMELSSDAAPTPDTSSAWVSEDAFGFLEPSVQKYCAGYKEFSHWGLTEIRREEWLAIKEDWQRLAAKAARANTASEYNENVWLQSDGARNVLNENFSAVRSGLPQLVSQLSDWVESAMSGRQGIFLKGIWPVTMPSNTLPRWNMNVLRKERAAPEGDVS